MNKLKARIVTGILALFVFTTMYISSGYAVRWYNTFRNIFSIFGEVMALWTFYRWLIEPTEDPKHADITVASGDTIPDGWLNPFKAIKNAKEKKNGSHMAKNDGLPDARDNGNRSESVSSRPVDPVRTGNGASKTVTITQNGTTSLQPKGTIFS